MSVDYAAAQAHFFEAYAVGEQERATTWSGSIENCDTCSRPMEAEIFMIDGPAQSSAQPMWGNLCVTCAFKTSPTIGWGKAQLYKRDGSEWRLVAGGPPLEHDLDL
jgi:hypothetical protein